MQSERNARLHNVALSTWATLLKMARSVFDDDKVAAVRTWPTPTCVKHVQLFLGLANYYSEYIEKFAEHAAPLSNLLRKS